MSGWACEPVWPVTAFKLDNAGEQETIPQTRQSVFHAFVLYNFILLFFSRKVSGLFAL